MIPLEAKGFAMMVVLCLLVWASIAAYNKTFVSSVDVTLVVDRAGLQLPIGGDVRMRGSLVGRIDAVESRPDGDGVVIKLALEPEDARNIPDDVVGRILPTTLFGQKYVQLVDLGGDPSSEAISQDAVLREDKSVKALEITRVLDSVEPLLAAVHPQDLSLTLQALSEGLAGRGEQLGKLTSSARAYFRKIEPSLDTFVADLRLLASVTRIYGEATPGILGLLESVTTTGETVLDNRARLSNFLEDAAVFADATTRFLDRNRDGMVELNRTTRPVLALLARYAPEISCIVPGLINVETEAGKAFRNDVFHADVLVGDQFPGYTPADRPELGDVGTGPVCAGLPSPVAPIPAPRSNDGGPVPTPLVDVPGIY